MRRFFIDKNNITKNSIVITGKEAHHIKDVIRLKPGDNFIGLDGSGCQYICKVTKIGKDRIEAAIEDRLESVIKIPNVTLACAIPKLAKMDYIVQKATELRAQNLIPMQTARTELKLNEQKAKLKRERWIKIAKESSKQCGRAKILDVEEVKSFKEIIDGSGKYKIKLIPCLSSDTKPIKEVLSGLNLNSVIILIGPEGGFTPAEIDIAINADFIPVSLGPTVLRVDTAAIFTLSVVMYELPLNENL